MSTFFIFLLIVPVGGLKYRLGEVTLKIIHGKLYGLNEATNWCRGVEVTFTVKLHSTKSLLMLWVGSSTAYGMLEV